MRIFFIAILAFSTIVFSAPLKTKYRTDIDLTTGKAVTQEYASEFIVMQGRFVHVAEDITSVYVAIGESTTSTIGNNEIVSVPCRSEAGNEYLYVFDISNRRVYVIFSNGSRLVQFDLIAQ